MTEAALLPLMTLLLSWRPGVLTPMVSMVVTSLVFIKYRPTAAFLYDGNSYTTLDYPDAGGSLMLTHSGGNIVANYQVQRPNSRFPPTMGVWYTSFDYPDHPTPMPPAFRATPLLVIY